MELRGQLGIGSFQVLMQLYKFLLRLPGFSGRRLLLEGAKSLIIPKPFSVPGGVKMYLDPLEWGQSQLIQEREPELKTVNLIQTLLKEGDIYVDVGAHVGYHSLMARQAFGRSGRAILIEPQPYNCARILENWRANGFENLFLFVGLAGAHNQPLVTLRQQKEIDTSCLSLVLELSFDEARSFAVSMTRLDDLFDLLDVERIAVVKIDAEGMEYDILLGMENHIRSTDNIIMELLNAKQLTDRKYIELFAQFQIDGFEILTVFGDEWEPATTLPENNLWICKRSTEN